MSASANPGRGRGMVAVLTAVAMVAFAANSLLTRGAFQTTSMDAASFTALRLLSGAVTLVAILWWQGQRIGGVRTGWAAALLLFVYAAAFSFAYRNISTGAGALVLFASAQLTMISYGLYRGERASALGLLMALGGMAAFLAPSAAAPPLAAAALMALAGVAWGSFSLLGRSSGSPLANTASSFVWAVPLALVLVLVQQNEFRVDAPGVVYALLSGSIASGLGYTVWYWVRVRMTAISAGAVQLSVPVISAALGVLLLGESVTLWSFASAVVVLAGVGWVTFSAKAAERPGAPGPSGP